MAGPGRLASAAIQWPSERWVFYFVIPRVVAQSSNPGLRAFYRPFWMLRLRAA